MDFSVIGTHTWRLADLGAKHMLLREGIGWGNMPVPMVPGGSRLGTPGPARPAGLQGWPVPVRCDLPDRHAPGPAASWLISRFAGRAAD
ncbi:hypothetical protein ACU4GD_11575 [Cupriavidus basilensis]